MGFFGSKKPPAAPVPCPICDQVIYEATDRSFHYESHLSQIPSGQGDASGQYTWTCSCGPSRMKWPGPGAATMAMEYHFARAHGVPTDQTALIEVFDRNPNYRHMRERLG